MKPNRPHEPIVDCDDQPITLGTLVVFDALPKTDRYPAQPRWVGRVVGITDIDGDVDDYGRTRMINPTVEVEHGDGSVEEFDTLWTGTYWNEDAPFEATDLKVAFHGPATAAELVEVSA